MGIQVGFFWGRGGWDLLHDLIQKIKGGRLKLWPRNIDCIPYFLCTRILWHPSR